MKTLTSKEICWLVEECGNKGTGPLCDECPLSLECLYYYTGEKCGSVLEEDD